MPNCQLCGRRYKSKFSTPRNHLSIKISLLCSRELASPKDASGLKAKAASSVSKSSDPLKPRKKRSPSSAASAQPKEGVAAEATTPVKGPATGDHPPPRKRIKVEASGSTSEGIKTPVCEATPIALTTAAAILTGSESVTMATAVSCPAFVSTSLDLTLKPMPKVAIKKEPPASPSPSLDSPIPRAMPTFAASPLEEKFSLPMQTPQPSTQLSEEVHVIIQQPNVAALRLDDKTKMTSKALPHPHKGVISQDGSVSIQRPSAPTVVLTSSGSNPAMASSVHSGTKPSAMAVSVVKHPAVVAKESPPKVPPSPSAPLLVGSPHVVVGGALGKQAETVAAKGEQKTAIVSPSPVKVERKMGVPPPPPPPLPPSLPPPPPPLPPSRPPPVTSSLQSLRSPPYTTTSTPSTAITTTSQHTPTLKTTPTSSPTMTALSTFMPQLLEKLDKPVPPKPHTAPPVQPPLAPSLPSSAKSVPAHGVAASAESAQPRSSAPSAFPVSSGASSSGPAAKSGQMESTSSPLLISTVGRLLPSLRQGAPTDPRIRPPPPPPVVTFASPPPPPLPPPGASISQHQPVTTAVPYTVRPVQADVPKTVVQLLLKTKDDKEGKKKPLQKGKGFNFGMLTFLSWCSVHADAGDSSGRKDAAIAHSTAPAPAKPLQPSLSTSTAAVSVSNGTPAKIQAKTTESKTTETKVTPARTTETKVTPARTTETKVTPAKTTETKVTPTRTTETKVTPTRTTETKVTPTRTTETKVTPARTTESKPTPVSTAESKGPSPNVVSKVKPAGSTVSIVTPASTVVSIMAPTSSVVTPASTIEINVTPTSKAESRVTPVSSAESKVVTPVEQEPSTPAVEGKGAQAGSSPSEGTGTGGGRDKEAKEEVEGEEMDEEAPVKTPAKTLKGYHLKSESRDSKCRRLCDPLFSLRAMEHQVKEEKSTIFIRGRSLRGKYRH